ncbi:hypothetical protein D3C81_1794980 [compost metagenome]
MWVSTTATEVAAHIFANGIVRAGMSFTYASDRRHDLTRRAIPTLESIKLYEGGLHSVQGTVGLSQPFDGGHVTALDLSS